LGISPVINSASRFKNIVAQILDHIDGYMVCDEQGRFGVGLVRVKGS
jgi:hypothetical protein